MPTIIELPHVGESVTEGVINKWLKEPGEHVDKYEPLVEVMTDKVNMEVPSPHAGRLVRTLVAEGDTVLMGEPICEMEVDGEEGAEPARAAGESASGASILPGKDSGRADSRSARSFEFLDSVRSVGPTGSGEGGRGRPDTAAAEGESASGPSTSSGRADSLSTEAGQRKQMAATGTPRLSPLVQRLVRQHDVDVSHVRATGRGGRITKDDVLRHVEARGEADADTTVLPLTALRKTIAAHMERSAREIPAAWAMVEADVTGLVSCRDAHRSAFQRDHGFSLTYLPFALQAVAHALRGHPRLNARWDVDRVTLHDRMHVGIAVATDGGLIVPVVHDADALDVTALAVRVHELAAAARGGKLTLDDVQGGTFTLDNTGALGSVVSVAIINHPQAAIITTEAVVKRPVVRDDAIVARSMMNLCLTFDHRVCDGADAGRFLADVKSRLEAIDEQTALE